MTNDFGFTDAYEAARAAQEHALPSSPQAGSWWQPALSQDGPLGGLQDQVAGVLNAADSHHIYLPGPGGAMLSYPRRGGGTVLRDMALGGLAGFAGVLVSRRMQRRRQLKGEWTSPGFRALGLLVFPILAALALSMAWPAQSVHFLGAGALVGIVLSALYTLYRAAGGGRYNTRKRGSPFREDHRPR